MAIKPRVFVTVRKSRTPHPAKSPYIDGCFDEMGVKGSVYINSQLPSSSGLGSSAAVTVATLAAINDEFDINHSREQIAEIAFNIEKKVQRGRASPTDTTVSTYGGLVFIMGVSRRRLPPESFQMVIGNTMVSHSTSKMVEMVADLKKKNPEICDPVLDAIGGITMSAMHHLIDPVQPRKTDEHEPFTPRSSWSRPSGFVTACAVRQGRRCLWCKNYRCRWWGMHGCIVSEAPEEPHRWCN